MSNSDQIIRTHPGDTEADASGAPATASLSAGMIRSPTERLSRQPARKPSDLTGALAAVRETPVAKQESPAANAPTAGSGTPTAASLPRPPALPQRDIVAYWSQLRHGRRWPSWSDFDVDHVAAQWPDSLMLVCRGGDSSDAPGLPGQVFSVSRVGGPPDPRMAGRSPLAYGSGVSEWIMATAREAIGAGRPVKDTETFSTPGGMQRLTLTVLPLSDDQRTIVRLLCHLQPT